MGVTEVSTRSIAEIDLNHIAAGRFSPYFGELPCLGEPQGNFVVPTTDISFIELPDASQHDLLVYASAVPHHGTVGVIQCKTEPREEERDEPSEAVSRIAFEDIEPFVRRSVESSLRRPTERPGGTTLTLQYRALTNWFRSVAENEPSRPILNIEDTSLFTIRSLEQETHVPVPVTVSPALRREVPTTKVGGLGHVSAGLLLWLESSDSDDDDV